MSLFYQINVLLHYVIFYWCPRNQFVCIFFDRQKNCISHWVEDFSKSNLPSTVCWITYDVQLRDNNIIVTVFEWWRSLRVNFIKFCVINKIIDEVLCLWVTWLSIPFNHTWLGVQLPSIRNGWLLCSSLNSFDAWFILRKNARHKANISTGFSMTIHCSSSRARKYIIKQIENTTKDISPQSFDPLVSCWRSCNEAATTFPKFFNNCNTN